MSKCQHGSHVIVENSVLRKISGPERDELTGEWRRLHGEELHKLYSLPNIISGGQIKKNEMGGACSAYGGRGEGHRGFWRGNQRERAHSKDLNVRGKVLTWILKK
jgi:hypothetical protein